MSWNGVFLCNYIFANSADAIVRFTAYQTRAHKSAVVSGQFIKLHAAIQTLQSVYEQYHMGSQVAAPTSRLQEFASIGITRTKTDTKAAQNDNGDHIFITQTNYSTTVPVSVL